jgi:hypothetical protein
VEQLTRLRYLFASLTFRNKPVVKKIRDSEGLVEEVIAHCPKPYRLMCYLAAKELNLNLSLIAAAGRDVPTAVALALEDATTGNPHLPNFWRYIKTGDPGPDIQSLLDKWRKTARKMF